MDLRKQETQPNFLPYPHKQNKISPLQYWLLFTFLRWECRKRKLPNLRICPQYTCRNKWCHNVKGANGKSKFVLDERDRRASLKVTSKEK
jgi:hypothetical protein